MIRRLAPDECSICGAENNFRMTPKGVTCSRCGHLEVTREAMPANEPESTKNPNEVDKSQYPIKFVGISSDLTPWAEAKYNTALHHIKNQHWDDAIDSLQQVIEDAPDFADAHLWLGRLLDDPDEKRKHFENVLGLRAKDLNATRELMVLDGEISWEQMMNYDAFSSPEAIEVGAAVSAEAEKLQCPRCGSPTLEFDEASGMLLCGSCGHEQVNTHSIRGDLVGGDLQRALIKQRSQAIKWIVGERLLSCNSCGAERTIPAKKMKHHCPFCGSDHVIETDALGSFQRPDGMLPFKVAPQQARELLNERLTSRMERLKGIFGNNKVQRVTAVPIYLPFWVFDIHAEIMRTITVVSTDDNDNDSLFGSSNNASRVTYQDTTYDAMFNVAVPAVKSPPTHLLNNIIDYKYQDITPYDARLISKFSAEIYTMEFDTASLEARSICAAEMRSKHGRNTFDTRVSNVFINVQQMTYRLLLLPVWAINITEEDGDTRLAVINGQTGTIALGKAHKVLP